MPAVASQCARLAEEAEKEKQSHLSYLDALLEAEEWLAHRVGQIKVSKWAKSG
jgi:hypothetical protein